MELKHTETAPAALGYRPEIDGLRAIAVLAVVIFHARLGVLRGGYAGVDVFFVISGFLISRLIVMERERTGGFSLAGFYERRIRRLFPALGLMVLASALAGWLLLPPVELTLLARSVFAALAFFSNLHFAKETGYFQPRAETQPLLHTWSLGVEEQFYILAPFLIVGLLMVPGLWRRLVLGALLVFSLSNATAMSLKEIDGAFFWPHTRAYELLTGVALGLRLVPLPSGERARLAMAAAGLTLMAGALFGLPPGIHFPGAWALLPCMGTALVIAATEGGPLPGLPGLLLRAAPMRFFGKISYSLYLWHWPVLVYADLALEEPPGAPVRIGLMALAVGLSYASWRFVETPARHGVAARRLVSVFAPALGVIAAGFAFAALVKANTGFANRFGPAFTHSLAQMNQPERPLPACVEGDNCFFGAAEGPVRFIVFGDSHAGALAAELNHLAKAKGVRGIISTAGGCPPLLDGKGQQVLDRKNCRRATERVMRYLDEHRGATVIYAARWALYAEAARVGDDEIGQRVRRLAEGGVEANRAAFTRLLLDTIAQMRAKGAQVRIIAPVPEFPVDVLQLASRSLMRGETPRISLGRADFDARQRAVFAAFEQAKAQGVPVFYPHEALCDAARCLGSKDGIPLYGDSNHLTARAVNMVSPLIAGVLD